MWPWQRERAEARAGRACLQATTCLPLIPLSLPSLQARRPSSYPGSLDSLLIHHSEGLRTLFTLSCKYHGLTPPDAIITLTRVNPYVTKIKEMKTNVRKVMY